MRRNAVTVVGAAETTDLGRIENLSQIGLHADADIWGALGASISSPSLSPLAILLTARARVPQGQHRGTAAGPGRGGH